MRGSAVFSGATLTAADEAPASVAAKAAAECRYESRTAEDCHVRTLNASVLGSSAHFSELPSVCVHQLRRTSIAPVRIPLDHGVESALTQGLREPHRTRTAAPSNG